MTNPTAAMLVIGDEILSGRTQDSNTFYLAGQLTAHGINLKEVRVVSDDTNAIIDSVRALSNNYTHVFTCGGIGPTHDDITSDSIAKAFDTHIDIREDARCILQQHYDAQNLPLNDARLRIARIPNKATLIDNPVSKAPGFTLKNVHVMAGVPSIFKAMLASVLPNIIGGQPLMSETYRVEKGEGDIAAPLSALADAFPDLSVGCYPFQHNGLYGANIVLRGHDAAVLKEAIERLKIEFLK